MGFNFWYRWIITASFFIFLCGLFIVITNYTSLFDNAFNSQVNQIFWNVPSVPPETKAFQQFVYGLLGAAMIGWGIMMTYVASHPFRKQEQWAWHCFTWSVIFWFITDVTISIYHQVYINAYLDIFFLLLFAIPLIFSKKYFFHWSRI